MSRDDDFNFDNDDLFGDDDIGGFDDDDMFGDADAALDGFDADNTRFDGDDGMFGDDEEFDLDDGLSMGGSDYDDDFFGDDGEEERAGPNRTFVILAGVMIIVFILALMLILFLATRDDGPNPVEQTRVAILDFNATQEALANQTATQGAILLTEDANVVGQTQEAQETEQANLDATATQAAVILTEDAEAAIISVTQTAIAEANATQAAFLDPTPTVIPTDDAPAATPTMQATSDTGSVALTATALAALLDPTPTQEGGSGGEPTSTPGGVTVPGGETGGSNELPQTGFFDEPGGVGLLALIALALVGVIFGARRLRTASA